MARNTKSVFNLKHIFNKNILRPAEGRIYLMARNSTSPIPSVLHADGRIYLNNQTLHGCMCLNSSFDVLYSHSQDWNQLPVRLEMEQLAL